MGVQTLGEIHIRGSKHCGGYTLETYGGPNIVGGSLYCLTLLDNRLCPGLISAPLGLDKSPASKIYLII